MSAGGRHAGVHAGSTWSEAFGRTGTQTETGVFSEHRPLSVRLPGCASERTVHRVTARSPGQSALQSGPHLHSLLHSGTILEGNLKTLF